jgi:hypothetical protein
MDARRWRVSRIVIPLAYSEMIISSKPPASLPLGTRLEANVELRSGGWSRPTAPTSVSTVNLVSDHRRLGRRATVSGDTHRSAESASADVEAVEIHVRGKFGSSWSVAAVPIVPATGIGSAPQPLRAPCVPQRPRRSLQLLGRRCRSRPDLHGVRLKESARHSGLLVKRTTHPAGRRLTR